MEIKGYVITIGKRFSGNGDIIDVSHTEIITGYAKNKNAEDAENYGKSDAILMFKKLQNDYHTKGLAFAIMLEEIEFDFVTGKRLDTTLMALHYEN